LQRYVCGPDIVEREGVVVEPQEWADSRGGIAVLRLGQQERVAPLEIAQVDVVAQSPRRWPPLDTASTIFGSGFFQLDSG
jgi:hypothetical protein